MPRDMPLADFSCRDADGKSAMVSMSGCDSIFANRQLSSGNAAAVAAGLAGA
jgi:hypothetical protein